jgi:hypothetical protein
MHAMVSISVMIECVSIMTALVSWLGGDGSIALAQGSAMRFARRLCRSV